MLIHPLSFSFQKFFLDADGGVESDQEEDLGNDGDGLLAERSVARLYTVL